MAGNSNAQREGMTFDDLKKYSDRCNSEYKLLNKLAKQLYTEFDGLVEYISQRVKEEENEGIKKKHTNYSSKFINNNKAIGNYSSKLRKSIAVFEAKKEDKLLEDVKNYHKLLIKVSAETANIFIGEMAPFYGSLAKATGMLKELSQLMNEYADKLIGVYIPDGMKQKKPQPQASHQPQATA